VASATQNKTKQTNKQITRHNKKKEKNAKSYQIENKQTNKK
jgi:hypothetical protein